MARFASASPFHWIGGVETPVTFNILTQQKFYSRQRTSQSCHSEEKHNILSSEGRSADRQRD